MDSGRWWQRGLDRWLLAAALSASSGCLAYLHPVAPPPPELAEPCASVPKCCRDHVYIFLIHGLDPFDYANLSGVRDYLHRLGFNKTYYGQLYHTSRFQREIHRIHEEDPEAHFVLIGFSYGANMVRNLAQAGREERIYVDLLVYLGGNTLENIPRDRPENAGMVVNILASGFIWNGTTFDDAENIHLPDVWHFGSPTHRYTLEVLARDLATVAASVSATQPAEPTMPLAFDEPTPRPVKRRASAKRGEWDFLKPEPTVISRPTSYRQP